MRRGRKMMKRTAKKPMRRRMAQALPNRPLNAWEGQKYFGTSTRSTTTPRKAKPKPKMGPMKKAKPLKRKTPSRRYYA